MDSLELAIRAAAKELETDHEFFFEETGEDELVQIMKKHIAPLVDVEQYKAMRIAALKTEISALESMKKPKRPNAKNQGDSGGLIAGGSPGATGCAAKPTE